MFLDSEVLSMCRDILVYSVSTEKSLVAVLSLFSTELGKDRIIPLCVYESQKLN